MNKKEAQIIDFGNWVPSKMIVVPGILGCICLGLGFIHWGFLVVAVLFLGVTAYFGFAWRVFSPTGGDIQDAVRNLVISHIEWDGKGKVLDIGCGNGPLTVKIAQRYPEAEIIGIDY